MNWLWLPPTSIQMSDIRENVLVRKEIEGGKEGCGTSRRDQVSKIQSREAGEGGGGRLGAKAAVGGLAAHQALRQGTGDAHGGPVVLGPDRLAGVLGAHHPAHRVHGVVPGGGQAGGGGPRGLTVVGGREVVDDHVAA